MSTRIDCLPRSLSRLLELLNLTIIVNIFESYHKTYNSGDQYSFGINYLLREVLKHRLLEKLKQTLQMFGKCLNVLNRKLKILWKNSVILPSKYENEYEFSGLVVGPVLTSESSPKYMSKNITDPFTIL